MPVVTRSSREKQAQIGSFLVIGGSRLNNGPSRNLRSNHYVANTGGLVNGDIILSVSHTGLVVLPLRDVDLSLSLLSSRQSPLKLKQVSRRVG